MDTLGATRWGEMVVSGGAITVLLPLGPTNLEGLEGRGDGEEGAFDEQTAGRNDDGAHHDMKCIGFDTLIQ